MSNDKINITKEELKSPDQVTAALRKGFVWTAMHTNLVFGLLAAFIVIGGGLSIKHYLDTQKEQAQQEKYYFLEKAYTEKKRGFEEAQRAAMMPTKDVKAESLVLPTADLEKDYGSIVTDFEAFVSAAPKTHAAQMASLHLSHLYMTYNKLEEASAVLAKVSSNLDGKDVLTALVLMQTGNVFANKGDCKQALSSWEKLTSHKQLAYSHDEAKLRIAMCYEKLEDMTKAENIYSELSKREDVANSDLAAVKEAQKYLRLLKAKKNL